LSHRASIEGVPQHLALLALPFISAVGSYYSDRNLQLFAFLLLGLTALLVAVKPGISDNQDRLFMAVIVCVSLSLLLSTTLLSDNLVGWDIHQEYAIFSQVLSNGVWRPTIDLPYNSVLSVSLLPAILSVVSGLDGLLVFRIVFPLLFCTVPLFLYKLYRQFLNPRAAFLSAFLFMSFPSFYTELPALARQEIAEIFLVLVLWFAFSTKVRQAGSTSFVVLALTVGLITAHYSIAFIYIYIVALSFLLFRFVLRRDASLVYVTKPVMIAMTASITVLWYAFVTSGSDLAHLTLTLLGVSAGALKDFLNPSSRPLIVSEALGYGVHPGLLHDLNRATNYAINMLLILGFLVFAFKRQKSGREEMILPFATSGFVLLGASVVLPHLAGALNFGRTYHIALLFVAPCFFYGCARIYSSVKKVYAQLGGVHLPSVHMRFSGRWAMAAFIIVSYLLFTSGWVWAVSMDLPTSYTFDGQRILSTRTADYYNYFDAPEDVASARWLRPQLTNGSSLCSDFLSRSHIMTAYGGIPEGDPSFDTASFPLGCDFKTANIFYFNVLNTRYGIGMSENPNNLTFPVSVIYSELGIRNRAYSNGGTVIYA
jgi:uncharacterized membrane protein